VKQHSNFHAGPSIVFWLVLQLKVLHEIIVTNAIYVLLIRWEFFFTAKAIFS